MKKKIAWLLSLVMILTSLPISALAEENNILVAAGDKPEIKFELLKYKDNFSEGYNDDYEYTVLYNGATHKPKNNGIAVETVTASDLNAKKDTEFFVGVTLSNLDKLTAVKNGVSLRSITPMLKYNDEYLEVESVATAKSLMNLRLWDGNAFYPASMYTKYAYETDSSSAGSGSVALSFSVSGEDYGNGYAWPNGNKITSAPKSVYVALIKFKVKKDAPTSGLKNALQVNYCDTMNIGFEKELDSGFTYYPQGHDRQGLDDDMSTYFTFDDSALSGLFPGDGSASNSFTGTPTVPASATYGTKLTATAETGFKLDDADSNAQVVLSGDSKNIDGVKWEVYNTTDSKWEAISGATGVDYTPTADMVGKKIRFTVTKSDYNPASSSELTVGAVELDLSALTGWSIADKTYDGETNTTVASNGIPALTTTQGALSDDITTGSEKVKLTATAVAFEDANVAYDSDGTTVAKKKVTLYAGLTGDNAAGYTLKNAETTGDNEGKVKIELTSAAKITPAELTLQLATNPTVKVNSEFDLVAKLAAKVGTTATGEGGTSTFTDLTETAQATFKYTLTAIGDAGLKQNDTAVIKDADFAFGSGDDAAKVKVTATGVTADGVKATITVTPTIANKNYTMVGSYTNTVDLAVTNKEITNIEITADPTTMEYAVGTTLDLTGMAIKVTYEDESDETFTSTDATFSNLPAEITITVGDVPVLTETTPVATVAAATSMRGAALTATAGELTDDTTGTLTINESGLNWGNNLTQYVGGPFTEIQPTVVAITRAAAPTVTVTYSIPIKTVATAEVNEVTCGTTDCVHNTTKIECGYVACDKGCTGDSHVDDCAYKACTTEGCVHTSGTACTYVAHKDATYTWDTDNMKTTTTWSEVEEYLNTLTAPATVAMTAAWTGDATYPGSDSLTGEAAAILSNTLTITNRPTGGGGGGGSTSAYTVKFDAGKNGEFAKGATTSVKVDKNTAIAKTDIPTVTAKDGYKFLGWSLDGKTVVDPTAAKVTKAVTYTALYEEIVVGDTHAAYMNGNEKGEFMPDANITRAEAAALLARLVPSYDEDKTYTGSFADVAAKAWYANEVYFDVEQGYITGYEDGTFKPANNITRQEFAIIVARYLGLENEGTCSFADCNGVYAEGYISQLVGKGILSGYEDGTFRPNAYITRAEATKVLNGVFDRVPDKAAINEAVEKYDVALTDVSARHWAYYEILEAAIDHEVADFHK